jgi:hypothetical protein
VAKQALLQRELKREKLAAKFAKKYTELKATAGDAKQSDEARDAARLALQKLTRPASATAARSPVVRVARSPISAWLAPRCARWRLPVKSPASPKPAGKP